MEAEGELQPKLLVNAVWGVRSISSNCIGICHLNIRVACTTYVARVRHSWCCSLPGTFLCSAVQVCFYRLKGNQWHQKALFRRRLGVVELLLRHEGANLGDCCDDTGDTVLHMPGWWKYWAPGSLDPVKMLLDAAQEKGFDVNIKVKS